MQTIQENRSQLQRQRQRPATKCGSSPYSVIVSVLCAALTLLVAVLAVQNRSLKETIAAASTASDSPPPAGAQRERLAPGDSFGDFDLVEHEGNTESILFDGGTPLTLLMVFAEQCPACPYAFPDWTEIAPLFAAETHRVIGLRLDAASEPTPESLQLGIPLFTLKDARSVPLSKLATVPLTVLIDSDGIALWVHYGPLAAPEREELLSFIGG